MPYMAVQCFSCHHMQVKEVRKSSSSSRKWSCAICNEKQSVRKVFSSADTAKDVRKFVQQFNLTAGQAAHAEGISRLETGSPADESFDYLYQEDEGGQMDRTMVAHDYPGQRKYFKWDKYLHDEEHVRSEDKFAQSSDEMKVTTTLPEPTSRRRTRPRSSSPHQKRPLRASITSVDDTDAEPGSCVPSDHRKGLMYDSLPDISLEFQRGNESESEGSTRSGKSTWKSSTAPKSMYGSLPTDSECFQKHVKSCHAQEPRTETSKWSKYLSVQTEEC